MAKEAIEAVKAAEEKAREILLEAGHRSRDSRRDAELTAERLYKEILEKAEREAQLLRENAVKEGESIAGPIIETGKLESQKIASLQDNDLSGAVNLIIERIVNADGNS
ncbi:MAG TPA: ATPase [Clostridiaceae bacterium]|nr:ATPase [Clostridiaceae bacterium]